MHLSIFLLAAAFVYYAAYLPRCLRCTDLTKALLYVTLYVTQLATHTLPTGEHMEIDVSQNLRCDIEDEAACRRSYGADMTKKIALRLAALRAAESLGDFWPPKSGPERCHELKGDLAGTFSIDVKQPYRMLFKPKEDPAELDPPDEQQRWQAIKPVEILAIEDTHG